MMDRMAAWSRRLFVSGALLASAVQAAEPHHPEFWPAAPSGLLIDREIEAKIDRRLGAMSLEDKIGQMIQADIQFIRPEDLARFPLGALLAGGDSAPDRNVLSAPARWREMVEAYAQKAGPIPLLFGIDAVHGDAKIVGATIFPHNIGLGAAHDPELAENIARATAEEVAATGFDWAFAPTVAVVRDPRWGRSYESFSEDPHLVADYAGAVVRGFEQDHILTTAKHFIGDGGTEDGRDEGDNRASERDLAAIDGAAYRSAIAAGDGAIMVSYNAWRSKKMMADHYLITTVLKGAMHFNGFVIGDWNAQEQVPGCSKFDCPEAINAGVDMLMAPDSWRQIMANLVEEARNGVIPMARIDDAVRRILRVKYLAGLFDRSGAGTSGDLPSLALLGSAEHRALARKAVRESLVLLKNDGRVLPIPPKSRVLVAGAAAAEIKRQMGGWTIHWQGNKNTAQDFPGATPIAAALAARAQAQGGSAEVSPTGDYTLRPDVAVVVFGEDAYAEYQGDLENLDFSRHDGAPLALLKKLRAQGIPTIALFLSGRPLWVNPELNASDAFIAAWLPGSEGEGIADLLFPGPDDFTGRLPVSWPPTAMPVRFDRQDRPIDPLFPRGYGLRRSESSHFGTLSEDPAIAPSFSHEDTLFDAAHVTAPWSLAVVDDRAETRLTTSRQTSPHGALRVTLGRDAALAQWRGGMTASLRFFGRAADYRRLESVGGGVSLRYRLDRRPDAPVRLEIGCKPDCLGALDITDRLEPSPPGEWRTLQIPYASFAATGVDFARIDVPLALTTAARMDLSIQRIQFTEAIAHPGRAEQKAPAKIRSADQQNGTRS